MGAGGADEDDGLARLQPADAVEDIHIEQRPALAGFLGDLLQGLLGHARIVFKEHAGHFLAFVEVAHVADEADHRAYADVGRVQRIELEAGIEGGFLHANGHLSLRSLSGRRRPRRRRPALRPGCTAPGCARTSGSARRARPRRRHGPAGAGAGHPVSRMSNPS
ncbi:hypothetical protein D3C85_1405410 [compost metagenome]